MIQTKEVISDATNNLLFGTYTHEKSFQYYNLSNVVLNITRETPPELLLNNSYNFTMMGVSEDNWVNLVLQKNLKLNKKVVMNAHEIDYKIHGEEMQFVEIELDPKESVVAEAGSFMMMDAGVQMNTIFGDGSGQNEGVLGKLFSAGKRLLTGESLFMTVFTNVEFGKKHVSFAAPYPGRIIAIDLSEHQGRFICQKDAFLCAAKGVSVGIEFSRKLGRGLFGGEGFIMQKLEGDGLSFVHAGGTITKKVLKAGEILKVDTGCLVGFTKDVNYDIEFVGGIKNTIFGGEGLFFASLQGPGTVYIQSLPFSRLAGRVLALAPRTGGKTRGEGSVLGGIGDLLDGDNH